jgi:hypothetical protein
MSNAIETTLFDVVYGKLLGKNVSTTAAKALAKMILTISHDTGVSTDELLKNVSANGIRFDTNIYRALNSTRTNSSQIGYIDINNVPPVIKSQIV